MYKVGDNVLYYELSATDTPRWKSGVIVEHFHTRYFTQPDEEDFYVVQDGERRIARHPVKLRAYDASAEGKEVQLPDKKDLLANKKLVYQSSPFKENRVRIHFIGFDDTEDVYMSLENYLKTQASIDACGGLRKET